MFTLREETYTWPVTVHTPADGGTWREGKFEALFKLVDLGQLLAAEASALRALGELEDARDVAEAGERDAMMPVLKAAWIGWTGIVDESGEELEFTEERRDALLRDRADVRRGVWTAFLESIGPKQDAPGN